MQAGAGNGGGPSQLQSLGPGEEDAGRVRRSASPEPQWTAGEATRGRALGGAAHTSPRRSPSRLHFLTCLFTSFPLLLSLSLEIQERAERAAWPRRQHQRRLERRPERWTQRLENWISSELSGIQVPQPGDHTVTPAEAAAESARTLDLNGTCSRSLFKRPVFY